MFKWLKKLLRDEELESRIATLETAKQDAEKAKTELEGQLKEANAELGVFRQQKEEDEAKRNSSEPWVEIRGADHDNVKGFRIELDWNDAFIAHLKESGIKGSDDDEVVQKWLALMYQHLVEQLETKVIDNKDKRGTVSDFA